MAVIEAGRIVLFEECFNEGNDVTGVARALHPLDIPELKTAFYADHLADNDDYPTPAEFYTWLLAKGHVEDAKPAREFLGDDMKLDMPR